MPIDDGEVAIVGGGTMGAMALWRLASRGVKAVCFEQYSPGHDRGAAGGETRIFRTAYAKSSMYVPLLRESRELWQALEAESGRRLLGLTNSLAVGDGDSASMRTVSDSIERYGLPHEVLDADEFAARFPQHSLLDGDAVVLDHEGGYLRPDLALVAATRRAEELGGVVERYHRVEAVVPDQGGVTVRVDGTSRRFRTVVLAAGPWTGRFLPAAAPFLTVKRPTQAWFAARDPEQWKPENSPPLTRMSGLEGTAINGAYVLPSIDGVAVKLGLAHANHELVEDPDQLDRTFTFAQIEQLREVAERIVPGVYPDPIRLAAYVEAYTPDGHPLVGKVPGTENVVLLCGFSGHGFKLSPAFGDIAADFVIDGLTPRPIDYLSPGRYL